MNPRCDHDKHYRRQIRLNEYTTVDNRHPYDKTHGYKLAKVPNVLASYQPTDGTSLFDPEEMSVKYELIFYTRYTQGIGTWIPLGVFDCRYCNEEVSEGYWHFISWARYVREGDEEKEGFVEQ